jgi:hypothetical protein
VRDAYVGIDVAFAKGKQLPISICTWQDGRLLPQPLRLLAPRPPRGAGNAAALDEWRVQAFARDAVQYVRVVCGELGLRPRRIGIDAPSSPRAEGIARRVAETALDRERISCFATPSATQFLEIRARARAHLDACGPDSRMPHANQLWMIVGFALFRAFGEVGTCLEVFPQATVRALGTGGVHKLRKRGVEAGLAAAAPHTGWPSGAPDEPLFADIAHAPAHDRLDAYLSAWVAALEEPDREGLGIPPDDVIRVPRIESPRFAHSMDPLRTTTGGGRKAHQRSASRGGFLCPACGDHAFRRWPLGWDAHAAYRCTGLTSTDPAERKREFRARFGELIGGEAPPR